MKISPVYRIFPVYVDDDGTLNFEGGHLATLEDLNACPPDELSIWGALDPEDWVQCTDGTYCARDFQVDEHPERDRRRVARIYVQCGDLELFQAGLILPTGEFLPRDMRGISETFEPGELPLEAARRGLSEELGLSGAPSFLGMVMETKVSPSTQILTDYEFWDFEIEVNSQQNIPLRKAERKGVLLLEWRSM